MDDMGGRHFDGSYGNGEQRKGVAEEGANPSCIL